MYRKNSDSSTNGQDLNSGSNSSGKKKTTNYYQPKTNTGTKKNSYKSYDDGYDAVYDDDDYDYDRYNRDPDYADGVDDALDDLDW